MSSEYLRMLDECAELMAEEMTGWKPPETTTVRMDGRHKHIQMLLRWDKLPRGPPPRFPDCPLTTLLAKVQREDYERVLAQYKRVGYAYAEVKDVDADEEEYGDVNEQDPEYQEARRRKEELEELGPEIESLVEDSLAKLASTFPLSEKAESGKAVTKLANPKRKRARPAGYRKRKRKHNRARR